jgi:HAD superfamily hydrolase (TIGR01490 family)
MRPRELVDAGGVSPPGPPRSAAFFDFDKTLLHGDAGVIFGWALLDWMWKQAAKFPLGSAERRKYERGVQLNAARIIAKGAAMRTLNVVGILKRSRMVELSYEFLEGFAADEMSREMARAWHERIEARLYPKMREVLDDHRKAGRRIVIVTTGLQELIEHARSVLGEDIEVIGARMQVSPDGHYLGRVVGPLYGVHKAQAVRAWAQANGVDLTESYAYSDHFSDVAFLEAVGHPIAVNPTLRLQMHARKKGWNVLWVMPPSTRDSHVP